MTKVPFSAAVRPEDGVVLVDFTGDIDRDAGADLDAAYTAAAELDGSLVLNFGDVNYINSTGIALIVSMLARARTTGREVSAFGLSDHYRQIFEITRLSDFMDIYEEKGAAVSAAGH
jgi:anti-sigma B factor antagonist